MLYAAPGAKGAKFAYKAQYDNFIGGKWVAPVKGQYFDVVTPISGKVYTKVARSTSEDIELALQLLYKLQTASLNGTEKSVKSPGFQYVFASGERKTAPGKIRARIKERQKAS
jgi:acyl-CoA reductase-like NAD-dependent aldehyde dehydrogenase